MIQLDAPPIIETELGEEKLCRGCGDYWPVDDEFFLYRDKTKGTLQPLCRACYGLRYRGRTVAR